jgi:hypothetical protein
VIGLKAGLADKIAAAGRKAAVALEFAESESFVRDPWSIEPGRALLRLRGRLDEAGRQQRAGRAAARLLGPALRRVLGREPVEHEAGDTDGGTEAGDEGEFDRRFFRLMVRSGPWVACRTRLVDSVLALALCRPPGVRGSQPHIEALRLVHLVELLAGAGLDQTDVAAALRAVPAAVVPLGRGPADAAPPAQAELPEPVPDEATLAWRNVHEASDFLLTLPRSAFREVVAAELPKEEHDCGDRTTPTTASYGVSFAMTAAALERARPEIRETLPRHLGEDLSGDIGSAVLELRHVARDMISTARPLRGVQVGSTVLTPAMMPAMFANNGLPTLDPLINPAGSRSTSFVKYSAFPGAALAPRFGALGVGELLVVRQNLKAYRPLDVAHIENVLKGEAKERSHRRRRVTEELFVTETESERSEERDTQTSERYELRSEVETEARENLKVEAGLKVSAKLGPFVELDADARFSYENAKTEGRRRASDYSKETTDRATTRFAERVLARRERRIVEEVEETNAHSLTAVGQDEHTLGVYQWVNKVYEAQVLNYGLRQMYEFFLPEPAAYYIGTLVSAAWSKTPGPTPPTPFTRSPGDLTPANYKSYAVVYNASSVPPPPDDFVKVSLAQRTARPRELAGRGRRVRRYRYHTG